MEEGEVEDGKLTDSSHIKEFLHYKNANKRTAHVIVSGAEHLHIFHV